MDALDTNEMGASHQLSSTAVEFMKKAAKWMKFVAIIGFIFVAIMVLFAVLGGRAMGTFFAIQSPGAGGVITAVYIIVALIFFFPNLFLFQSANHFERFAAKSEQSDGDNAFIRLNSLYVYLGVLFIIYLAFMVLALIGIAAGSTF